MSARFERHVGRAFRRYRRDRSLVLLHLDINRASERDAERWVGALVNSLATPIPSRPLIHNGRKPR